MPLPALTLLIMNNRTRWVGRQYRNGWLTNVVLVAALAFFACLAVDSAVDNLTKSLPSRGS